MTNWIRAKECLELVHADIYRTFNVHAWGGMGISSLLVMITPGLDIYIGNPMTWIHLLNLRQDRIIYWVYIPIHFD